MATLANPPSALDFVSYDDFPPPSYQAGFLNNNSIPGYQAMSYDDLSSFQSFFPSESDRQSSEPHRGLPEDPPRSAPLHPPPQDPSNFPPSLMSSSSDTSASIRSTTSSSFNSPQIQGPLVPPVTSSGPGLHPAFIAGTDPSNFHPSPLEPGFVDYESFLAGEGSSGFVGRSQDFSSSPTQVYGLFPNFAMSSISSQQEHSFQNPYASPRQAIVPSNQPVPSPSSAESFSESSRDPRSRGPRSRTMTPAGTGDQTAFRPPPRPATVSPASPTHFGSSTQRQDWAFNQPSALGRSFTTPEQALLSSPSYEQDPTDIFSFSPTLPSQFFHQSSGNFIAPLESSCWFSFTRVFASRVFYHIAFHFLPVMT